MKTIKYVVEETGDVFKFWGQAKSNVDDLPYNIFEMLWDYFVETAELNDEVTDTFINDTFAYDIDLLSQELFGVSIYDLEKLNWNTDIEDELNDLANNLAKEAAHIFEYNSSLSEDDLNKLLSNKLNSSIEFSANIQFEEVEDEYGVTFIDNYSFYLKVSIGNFSVVIEESALTLEELTQKLYNL